ncbi:MAG: hypothetical protein EXS31_11810 [Pedosphaera sp.]|nr:hypothetical protein [Pedosphaera sp.]
MKTRSTQRKNSAVGHASQSAGRSNYSAWSGGIAALLEEARRQSARSVNAILTGTYLAIGRRMMEEIAKTRRLLESPARWMHQKLFTP